MHPATKIKLKLGKDFGVDNELWCYVRAVLDVLEMYDPRPAMMDNPVDDVLARMREAGVDPVSDGYKMFEQAMTNTRERYAKGLDR